ncbi:MAG: hypothetical protein QOK00_561 [Thermoleophilaceae bacterium]|jgi:hypothetical protein|nr:hypothetical protein [Thermoleophilaceae bacterium]
MLLLLPASALGAVTLDQFTVTPSSTQAGGHPDVTIFQHVSPSSADDDVKDTFVRLAPGLLGNPQNAALCTREQFRSEAGCAAAAKVGTVHVTATVHLAPPLATLTDQPIEGTVYNLKPLGGEPARLGLKLQPVALPPPLPQGAPPVYLESPVYLKPGADGIGLESMFSDQPREQSGLNIQITSVQLTFLGKASRGSFMRMPTSCAPATSLGRVNSYDAPTLFSEKTSVFTPTGCDSLGFAPTAEGSLGATDATKKGSFPPVSTTLKFDPEEAALKSAEVTLPKALQPSVAVLGRACTRAQADATACPDSSRVGTAIIESPLQASPVAGPVYIAFNTPAALPGLMVVLPPPVDLRIDGVIQSTAAGLRNVFASNPDLPLSSFTLQFGGGPTGPLQLAFDLCAPSTPTKMSVKLTSHSGKTRAFKQELATPGCDPLATVKVSKDRRGFTLAAVLTAARRGPDMTRARLSLPKGLRPGRTAPRVVIDGKRVKFRRVPKAINQKLPKGARRVKIVWKGLKRAKGKKVARTLVVPVKMTDERGKTTSLRLRVKRG